MNGIKLYHYAKSYDDCSFVHCNFPLMLNIAININLPISYYAGIMLNVSMTRYAQNYAAIIGISLITGFLRMIFMDYPNPIFKQHNFYELLRALSDYF